MAMHNDVKISEKRPVDLAEVVRRWPWIDIITPDIWAAWELPTLTRWPWVWNSRGGYLEIVFPEPTNDFGVEVIAQVKTFERGPYARIWMDRSSPRYGRNSGTLWEGDVPSVPTGMIAVEQALDTWGCWGSADAIKWIEPTTNPFTPDRPMLSIRMKM